MDLVTVRIAVLSRGGAHGPKPPALGPPEKSTPSPMLCGLQREGYIPSLTVLLPLPRKTRSPLGMSILSSIGNFGLHLCDEISYKQGVNV